MNAYFHVVVKAKHLDGQHTLLTQHVNTEAKSKDQATVKGWPLRKHTCIRGTLSLELI